jgi:hypothetical protein
MLMALKAFCGRRVALGWDKEVDQSIVTPVEAASAGPRVAVTPNRARPRGRLLEGNKVLATVNAVGIVAMPRPRMRFDCLVIIRIDPFSLREPSVGNALWFSDLFVPSEGDVILR